MVAAHSFPYSPGDHEAEKASNSYLMSLLALMAGIPLPIVNLLATGIFYLGNRKSSFFVRWHCTQALLSQLTFLLANSAGFWWTMAVLFTDTRASSTFFAYLFTLVLFNILELIVTIYTAIETRKGRHVRWWFFADLTDAICKAE